MREVTKEEVEAMNTPSTEQVVPIVGPSGQFLMPRISPCENKPGGNNSVGGHRIALWSDVIGGYVIHKDYQGKWDLYEDICADAPEYYEKWQIVFKAEQSGNPVRDGDRRPGLLPDDFYHPEVYYRRNNSKNGKRIVDLAELLGTKTKSKGKSKKANADV